VLCEWSLIIRNGACPQAASNHSVRKPLTHRQFLLAVTQRNGPNPNSKSEMLNTPTFCAQPALAGHSREDARGSLCMMASDAATGGSIFRTATSCDEVETTGSRCPCVNTISR